MATAMGIWATRAITRQLGGEPSYGLRAAGEIAILLDEAAISRIVETAAYQWIADAVRGSRPQSLPIARMTKCRADRAALRQFREQRPGQRQVSGVEALRECATDLRQVLPGCCCLSLSLP